MKSSISIMRENCEEFISLSLRTRNLRRPSRTLARSWKHQSLPPCPCKIGKNNKNCGNGEKSNKVKSRLACILEASESKRLRVGESLPNHHEDHIAGKGNNLIAALQFGSQIYSYASSHKKFQQQKQQWTRSGKNWKRFRRGT